MARRFGSRDRRPRKKWGKHPVRPRYFHSPKGNKDSIKICFMEIKEMTKEGYLRWSVSRRNKITHETYTPLYGCLTVSVNEIDTDEKMAEFVLNVLLREGDFLVQGFSKGKNKFGVKRVSLCRVSIRETESGLSARMVKSIKLHRYKWFWHGT